MMEELAINLASIVVLCEGLDAVNETVDISVYQGLAVLHDTHVIRVVKEGVEDANVFALDLEL
jgi:hypothetical protein